jgi:orotate phosphoribosyltransferase
MDKISQKLLQIARTTGALLFGEFTLASGKKSTYYFDGRLVTLNPEGSYSVASSFLPILKDCGAEAIAGPSMGADPIIGAITLLSHIEGYPIRGLMVRKESKNHGTQKYVEGKVEPGLKVAVVDDTCTTAQSLFHAIEAIEAEGCQIVKVLAILDRNQGGSIALKRKGYDFQALLEADEEGNID